MSPSSFLRTGRNAKQSIAASSSGGCSERRYLRRRLQLSCGECRRKKVIMVLLTVGDRAFFTDESFGCSCCATGTCLARDV